MSWGCFTNQLNKQKKTKQILRVFGTQAVRGMRRTAFSAVAAIARTRDIRLHLQEKRFNLDMRKSFPG